ncbi:hypothetical protein GCM10010302_43620 [Streptomyces polychromogenes]|uniref:STAS domain-containing protein n=1 Tax=Streptomyces polychromogenes TaxID=67342 RepID=A0ABP3F3X1_9ACTN
MPAAFDVAVTAVSPGRALVAVAGELDVQTGPALIEAVDSVTLPGLEIAVDMSAVTFMDSHGLNALILLRRRAREAGATLFLRNVPGQALWVLDLTGTTGLFRLRPDPGDEPAAGPAPGARCPMGRCGACCPV